MKLSELIDTIKQLDKDEFWDLHHIARNFEMDIQGLDCSHPDGKSCGNRVESNAHTAINDGLATQPEPNDYNAYERQLNLAAKILSAQKLEVDNSDNPTSHEKDTSEPIKVLRVIDLRSIYTYWLNKKHDLTTITTKEIEQSVRDFIQKMDDRQKLKGNGEHEFWDDWDYAEHYLQSNLLISGGQWVWVVPTPEGEFFLDQLLSSNESGRAEMAAKKLALPFLSTPEERQEKIGLVIISYNIPKQWLTTPSIIQAGTCPQFFPGYCEEKNGRIGTLDDLDCTPPWQRTGAKERHLPEWTHNNLELKNVTNIHVHWLGLFAEAMDEKTID